MMMHRLHGRRGATFVVWLMLIGTVFFAVISSLLSGESAQYGRAVEEARSREALYLAEGGLARALAKVRNGDISAPQNFEYEHGRGEVSVDIADGGAPGQWSVRATVVMRQAQREWRESVTASITGAGALAAIENYHWRQNDD